MNEIKMTNQADIQTTILAVIPFLASLTDVQSVAVIIGVSISTIWVLYQLIRAIRKDFFSKK